MQALELLTTRSSMPRLIEPAPSAEQMALIEQAALRAPDHMQLMPYQFQCFQGKSREQLSHLFATAATQRGEPEAGVNKAAQLPFRAPLVMAAIMKHKPHDKVPRVEQICTTACAVMAIEQAAFAQGLGAIWRTGWLAFDPHVRAGLGLQAEDELVGFLYLGTPAVPTPIKPSKTAAGVFVAASA